MLLFGIIDLSYYVYGYATLSQAARNGAEAAAQLPPYQSWLNYGNPAQEPTSDPDWNGLSIDRCVRTIYAKVQSDAEPFFGDASNFTTITYPSDGVTATDTRNLSNRGPIQVTINYPISPLTPLFRWIGLDADGTWNVQVSARRSIESLGDDPSSPGRVPCAKDMDDWRFKNPAPTP